MNLQPKIERQSRLWPGAHRLPDSKRLTGRHLRFENPVVPGVQDVTSQPIYDAATFAAGAAMAKTTLFQTPIGQGGKTAAITNMTAAGVLPNPQRFLIRVIRVAVSNNTVPADMENLAANISFTLTIGTKVYLQVPLYLLSAGCGWQITAAGQLGTAGAAQNLAFYSTSLGSQDQRAAFGIIPLAIEQGQSFSVVLNPETAFNFAAAGGATVGVGATIRVVLDGDLYNAVQ